MIFGGFVNLQIAPLVMGEGGDANNPHGQTFIEIGTMQDLGVKGFLAYMRFRVQGVKYGPDC